MQIAVTHTGSDFDALASLVACSVLYPGIKLVLPHSINPNLKNFLSIHKDLFNFHSSKDIDFEKVKSLVVVDVSSWKRIEGQQSLKHNKDLEITLFDHHVKDDIKPSFEIRKETGAAVTLMIQEIQKQKKIITPIQATLFLMGIYEDTGNLTFGSTTPDDAYAAAYLLDRKADLSILNTFLQYGYGKKQKNVLFKMLEQTERLNIDDFTLSISTIEIKGRIQNLAAVVQMYREIVNVDVAFGIFHDIKNDKVMIIGRSGSDEINMGLIMRSLGGGGHPGAGSAQLKKVNPESIETMILELIKGNHSTSVSLSDIMSYPVITVNEDTKVEEVAMLLRDVGCTGVPVTDKDDKLVGIISRRDFKKVRKDAQMQSPIKAFMSRNPLSLSYEKSAMEAAKLMIKHDIGRIPIMKDDKIIGIITRSDAMLYFYDLLPD
ncbi:MAG: CBS domain-containing protein [Desulfobacteraceae bacterium]|nr:CBS domain-containing protein [Desulfobacteraceae bacterium]